MIGIGNLFDADSLKYPNRHRQVFDITSDHSPFSQYNSKIKNSLAGSILDSSLWKDSRFTVLATLINSGKQLIIDAECDGEVSRIGLTLPTEEGHRINGIQILSAFLPQVNSQSKQSIDHLNESQLSVPVLVVGLLVQDKAVDQISATGGTVMKEYFMLPPKHKEKDALSSTISDGNTTHIPVLVLNLSTFWKCENNCYAKWKLSRGVNISQSSNGGSLLKFPNNSNTINRNSKSLSLYAMSINRNGEENIVIDADDSLAIRPTTIVNSQKQSSSSDFRKCQSEDMHGNATSSINNFTNYSDVWIDLEDVMSSVIQVLYLPLGIKPLSGSANGVVKFHRIELMENGDQNFNDRICLDWLLTIGIPTTRKENDSHDRCSLQYVKLLRMVFTLDIKECNDMFTSLAVQSTLVHCLRGEEFGNNLSIKFEQTDAISSDVSVVFYPLNSEDFVVKSHIAIAIGLENPIVYSEFTGAPLVTGVVKFFDSIRREELSRSFYLALFGDSIFRSVRTFKSIPHNSDVPIKIASFVDTNCKVCSLELLNALNRVGEESFRSYCCPDSDVIKHWLLRFSTKNELIDVIAELGRGGSGVCGDAEFSRGGKFLHSANGLVISVIYPSVECTLGTLCLYRIPSNSVSDEAFDILSSLLFPFCYLNLDLLLLRCGIDVARGTCIANEKKGIDSSPGSKARGVFVRGLYLMPKVFILIICDVFTGCNCCVYSFRYEDLRIDRIFPLSSEETFISAGYVRLQCNSCGTTQCSCCELIITTNKKSYLVYSCRETNHLSLVEASHSRSPSLSSEEVDKFSTYNVTEKIGFPLTQRKISLVELLLRKVSLAQRRISSIGNYSYANLLEGSTLSGAKSSIQHSLSQSALSEFTALINNRQLLASNIDQAKAVMLRQDIYNNKFYILALREIAKSILNVTNLPDTHEILILLKHLTGLAVVALMIMLPSLAINSLTTLREQILACRNGMFSCDTEVTSEAHIYRTDTSLVVLKEFFDTLTKPIPFDSQFLSSRNDGTGQNPSSYDQKRIICETARTLLRVSIGIEELSSGNILSDSNLLLQLLVVVRMSVCVTLKSLCKICILESAKHLTRSIDLEVPHYASYPTVTSNFLLSDAKLIFESLGNGYGSNEHKTILKVTKQGLLMAIIHSNLTISLHNLDFQVAAELLLGYFNAAEGLWLSRHNQNLQLIHEGANSESPSEDLLDLLEHLACIVSATVPSSSTLIAAAISTYLLNSVFSIAETVYSMWGKHNLAVSVLEDRVLSWYEASLQIVRGKMKSVDRIKVGKHLLYITLSRVIMNRIAVQPEGNEGNTTLSFSNKVIILILRCKIRYGF